MTLEMGPRSYKCKTALKLVSVICPCQFQEKPSTCSKISHIKVYDIEKDCPEGCAGLVEIKPKIQEIYQLK